MVYIPKPSGTTLTQLLRRLLIIVAELGKLILEEFLSARRNGGGNAKKRDS